MAVRSRRAAAKRSNVVTLDLSGVEGRVNFTEGDHLLEVMEVTQEKGDKADYFSWKFKATEDSDSAGAIVYNNTSLSEQSLWNLRTLLEALGVEIPESEFELDLDEMPGLLVMGSIELETYEGKKRPRLADFWAAEEVKEKPARGKGKAAAKDDDEPELTARQKRAAARKAKASDEKDPEAKPSRSSRGSGKSSSKKDDPEPVTEDDLNEMSEEELQDVIDEHELDVDLGEFKTLRRQRAAVIDAAQEAGAIADDEPEPEPAPRRRASRR